MRLARREGRTQRLDCFKTLFIEDVDRAARDEVAIASARIRRTDQQLVRQILARKVTFGDRLIELMSTHPNMVKRLRALRGKLNHEKVGKDFTYHTCCPPGRNNPGCHYPFRAMEAGDTSAPVGRHCPGSYVGSNFFDIV